MQLVTLYTAAPATTAVQLDAVEAIAWPGVLQPAIPLTPLLPDEDAAPAPSTPETVALPTEPLFIVRQGWAQGQLVTVVAFSPIFNDHGVVKFVTHLRGQVQTNSDRAETSIRATNREPIIVADEAPLPGNPLAERTAVKIAVNTQGMQQVSGNRLAAAGLDLTTTDPTRLQLYRNGAPVPVQVMGLVNGRLTPTAILRFYAPAAGDRWNLTTTYWLVQENSAGLRMTTRAVTPDSAPVRTDGSEKGVLLDNRLYSSLLPGSDGDHWFRQALIYTPAMPPTMTLQLNAHLPAAAGNAQLTLATSTQAGALFQLQVSGAGASQTLSWHSSQHGPLIPNTTLPFTLPAQLQDLTFTLGAGDTGQGLLIDQLTWQRPALLTFGGHGAAFSGVAGSWRYQWQNAPTDPNTGGYALYDVTNPAAPLLLTGADSSGFQDGPQVADYLLVGPNNRNEPTVTAYHTGHLLETSSADALYIAPAELLSALEPLATYRRSQGYQVVLVNVQEIYDHWSFGQVSAEAIRNFLRYARATWQPAPLAVTLVGDGTWDPHNYEQKAYHTNLIPPYVVPVDPWLGEAACDNCYAQLDGDNPVTGDALVGDFFAADLWLGRLPVKSSAELSGVVNKLIHYDQTPNTNQWRNQHLFAADNYVLAVSDSGVPTYDKAGDFARTSDEIIAHLGAGQQATRVYYDPFPQISDPSGQQPWRITSAATAKTRLLSAMNSGVGTVVYNGHSHHWQWARFDREPSVAGLLALYDPDTFDNRDRLFITLSMTCLTAQFHKPADSGTVLDERQLLNPTGGAVAVWGPSGLSVVQGHDRLQGGFYQRWQQGGAPALGALIEAGYRELREQGLCCQDPLQTFLLLSDPLTTVRLNAAKALYLPIIRQ